MSFDTRLRHPLILMDHKVKMVTNCRDKLAPHCPQGTKWPTTLNFTLAIILVSAFLYFSTWRILKGTVLLACLWGFWAPCA